jgi:GNAT superfamily N-acetyltransferase
MVEISFEGGKARELREGDISLLIGMCSEEGILKYFFSSGTENLALYWQFQLSEQLPWDGRIDQNRTRYVLPVEHDKILKGCLVLEDKDESPKRKLIARGNSWGNRVPARKAFAFELRSWETELDCKRRSRPLLRSNRLNENGPLIETSYFVGRDYRRSGIATAVVRGAINFALERLDASKVVAKVAQGNLPSRRLLERQGFGVCQKGVSISGPSAGEGIVTYDLSSKMSGNCLSWRK